MSEIIFYIFIFILGSVVGSFLNVLINRIPRGENIVFNRSHCDKCKKTLLPFDLVPIFSFILLSGKCRYCHKKISVQNPVVEIVTGLMFTLTFNFADLPWVIFQWIILSTLITIFVIDLKEGIIPDILIVLLTGVTVIYRIFYSSGGFIPDLAAGLVFAFLFLFLVVMTRGRGMGLGDVKFAFFMGFFLGFPKIIAAFYIAFLTGTIISLILIILRKKSMKSTIPFGPFLVVSTVVSYYYGFNIVKFFQKIYF